MNNRLTKMIKFFGVFVIIIFFNFSYSQTLKGKITYQATITDSYIKNDVVMPPDLEYLEIKSGKDAVPINFLLFFNNEESMYKAEHVTTLNELQF